MRILFIFLFFFILFLNPFFVDVADGPTVGVYWNAMWWYSPKSPSSSCCQDFHRGLQKSRFPQMRHHAQCICLFINLWANILSSFGIGWLVLMSWYAAVGILYHLRLLVLVCWSENVISLLQLNPIKFVRFFITAAHYLNLQYFCSITHRFLLLSLALCQNI